MARHPFGSSWRGAALAGACAACVGVGPVGAHAAEAAAMPVDAAATAETRALFDSLRRLIGRGVLFGHQHTTCYGVGWKGDDDRSDVKDVTGSFPAVYGWDMGHAGTDHPARQIVDAFERGGVNTASWHMKNPVTGGA